MPFKKGNTAWQKKQAEAEKPAETASVNTGRVLTVNGQPLTDEQLVALAYRYTDQGKAEAAAADEASGVKEGPRIEFTRDEFSKRLDRLENSQQPDDFTAIHEWEYDDPVKQAKARIPNSQDFHVHLMDDRTVGISGTRGFVPAKDAKGNLIKVENLTLGVMPKDRWEQREKRFKQKSEESIKKRQEKERETQAELIGSAGGDLKPLRSVGDIPLGVTRAVGKRRIE